MNDVDYSEYFRNVINQSMATDTAFLNPAGIVPLKPPPTVAQQAFSWNDVPIGHSGIDDVRVYFDTLPRSLYNGFPTGEVAIQFAELAPGVSVPERVSKITVHEFLFPRIFRTPLGAFDYFYFRRAFLTMLFIPPQQSVMATSATFAFTFELVVNDLNSSAVRLTPLEPTFSLPQPITMSGDISLRFQVQDPRGAFIRCPIPPTRIRVQRVGAAAANTTFQIIDATDISAIAPLGAAWGVAVYFVAENVANPALAAIVENAGGYTTSNYVYFTPPLIPPPPPPPQVAGFQFTVDANTLAFPIAPAIGQDTFFVFVPKNRVALTLRFSKMQATRTNDLVPIHS